MRARSGGVCSLRGHTRRRAGRGAGQRELAKLDRVGARCRQIAHRRVDADTLEYNAYVSYETTRITVAAVPGHVSATIAYSWQNGQNSGDVATAPLHTGRITTATITVTAHNGFNTRTYQVVVHRSRSHLANLEIAGNSFHFYSGGTDYNLNVREEFSTLRVTAMAVDSDATISITDPRGGGTLSGAGRRGHHGRFARRLVARRLRRRKQPTREPNREPNRDSGYGVGWHGDHVHRCRRAGE